MSACVSVDYDSADEAYEQILLDESLDAPSALGEKSPVKETESVLFCLESADAPCFVTRQWSPDPAWSTAVEEFLEEPGVKLGFAAVRLPHGIVDDCRDDDATALGRRLMMSAALQRCFTSVASKELDGESGWISASYKSFVAVARVTGPETFSIVVLAGDGEDRKQAAAKAQALATDLLHQDSFENFDSVVSDVSTPRDGGCCGECWRRCNLPALQVCDGRGCGALLCSCCSSMGGVARHSKRRCKKCVRQAANRRGMLDCWRKRRALALERLSSGLFDRCRTKGKATRAEFALLPNLFRKESEEDDDCDPVLYEAFDCADKDGDGLIELHEAVEWLSGVAARAALDRTTMAMIDADPRAEFADWPERSGEALIEGVLIQLVLSRDTLSLEERTLAVQPRQLLARRLDPRVLELKVLRLESEEPIELLFETEDETKQWLSALSATLAISRRLGLNQAKIPIEEEEEEGEEDSYFFFLGGIATPSYPATPGGVSASAKKLKKKQRTPRRRSKRFSDEHEAEVSKGWAVDRVELKDGSVTYAAAAPRRLRAAWRSLVKLVIRPPRASYDVKELGPTTFEVRNGLDASFSKRFFVTRSDFAVVNTESETRLECSLWGRVRESTTGPRPCLIYCHGNASCRLEALGHIGALLFMGVSVCAFDAGGSGLSSGEYCTLGLRESTDVAVVGQHLVATGYASKIALFGRSMGAVASILAAARSHNFNGPPACVLADSPFSSLDKLIGVLTRSAACEALSAPQPRDILVARAPLNSGHLDEQGCLLPCDIPEPPYSARTSVAEAAAKAAVESVRGEVEERAAFKMSDVDVIGAIPTLDETPLFMIAASDDALMPSRAHAGAILDAYNRLHFNHPARLVLVKGGHNGRRGWLANRAAYAFVAKHLLEMSLFDTETMLASLENNFRKQVHFGLKPWEWLNATSPTSSPATSPAYVSGMTKDREARAMKSIQNIFTTPTKGKK